MRTILALAVAIVLAAPAAASAQAYTPTPADPGVAETTMVLRPGRAPQTLSAAEARALPTPVYCSGYGTLASTEDGIYSTRGNICMFESTGTFDVGAVARFQCFRYGVLFGSGTGGCRWVWNQVLQRSNDNVHWQTMTSNDNCYTCEGIFVDDSQRWYGNQIYALWCGYTLRAATRKTSVQPYRVRFYRTSGAEVLVDMATNISGHWKVPC
jgi:hypothetical protein